MKTVYDRMMENDSYQKTKDFIIKQKWPYPQKKAYAEKIAWEFYQHPDVAGRCYVTVGGLDSITLFLFLRSIGINVPAVSVSSLEDKSIQLVHKALGIRSLPPIKDENGRPYTKMRVIQQYGYPVISKEAAQKISHLQNPTSKNATVRHAIMTGETGEYGGFKKNSRMKMSQRGACETAERSYFSLLEWGCSPQEARSVLPNSLKTEVVMTANLREWRHFFKLRTAPAAHPQMREVAIPLLHRMQELIPVVFDDLEVPHEKS